jgi:hypothetical protein
MNRLAEASQPRPGDADFTQTKVNECNGDFSPTYDSSFVDELESQWVHTTALIREKPIRNNNYRHGSTSDSHR